MNMDSVEDDHEDYPWADFFITSSNPYYGWVRDLEAAQAVPLPPQHLMLYQGVQKDLDYFH